MADAEDGRPPVSEVLDLGVLGDAGAEEELDGDPARGPGLSRRRLITALAGTAALGAGALALRASRGAPHPHPVAPAQPDSVTHSRLPLPIAGMREPWQLFGLGSDLVVRVDAGSGEVTRTRIAPPGEGQVSFVPLRRKVVVRPVADRTGWQVPDDEAPEPLPLSLGGVAAVLPGSELDYLWIQVGRGGSSAMLLTDADGWGVPPLEVPVPEFATTGPMADGAGGLLFEGVGGLYRISPAGRTTVLDAILLAVGSGHLLTLGPDGRNGWRTTLRARGARPRALPFAIGPQLPHGILSPDAGSVVLYDVDMEHQLLALVVVDLATGRQRGVPVDITGTAGEGTVVWTPDSARILCVDTHGRVRIVEAASGGILDTLDLPPLRQLALRVDT